MTNPYQPPDTKPTPPAKPFEYVIASSIVFMLISCGVLALTLAFMLVSGAVVRFL